MNGKIETAFSGRVIKDPSFKLVKGGEMPLLTFVVVIGEGELAQFVRVTCFKANALALKDRLKKGSTVYCEGTIRMESWEKDGVKRFGLTAAAYKAELLGVDNLGRNKPKRPPRMEYSQAPFNDDIPFNWGPP